MQQIIYAKLFAAYIRLYCRSIDLKSATAFLLRRKKHSLQFKLLTPPIITGGVAVVGACAAPGERHLKWDKQ